MRGAAAAAAVAVAALALAPPAAADPSARYCGAFDAFDQVVARSLYAHGYEDALDLYELPAGERTAAAALLWSPMLHDATRLMAETGPKATRATWKSFSSVYARGIALLHAPAGLDDDQVELLARLDADDPDPRAFTRSANDSDLEVDDFERAARRFEPTLDEVTFRGVPSKTVDAVREAGIDCGVIATAPPTT